MGEPDEDRGDALARNFSKSASDGHSHVFVVTRFGTTQRALLPSPFLLFYFYVQSSPV
jgi:hypothetical protein